MTPNRERVGEAVDGGLRAVIVAVVVAGVRRRDPGAVANGLVGFAATFLPATLARRYDLSFRPRHRVWVSGSMLLHALGMLGPYDDTWWWDHVTHTLSASLVGASAHLLARRTGRDPTRAVIGAVLGGGVLWEAVEYAVHAAASRAGVPPVLVSYGRRDTAVDLVFDAVGALLVLAFGDRLLDGALDADRE